jgi:hypothetical protein
MKWITNNLRLGLNLVQRPKPNSQFEGSLGWGDGLLDRLWLGLSL